MYSVDNIDYLGLGGLSIDMVKLFIIFGNWNI